MYLHVSYCKIDFVFTSMDLNNAQETISPLLMKMGVYWGPYKNKGSHNFNASNMKYVFMETQSNYISVHKQLNKLSKQA